MDENQEEDEKPEEEDGRPKAIRAVSRVLEDGSLVELVYWPRTGQTNFVVSRGDAWTYQRRVSIGRGPLLVPYSPRNSLISNDVVLFPASPEEYGATADLVDEVRCFIRRYVSVSQRFLNVSTYYVLLTWVYDAFNELPYLRIRGDYGSGKTRFLLTVGAICYKPIFASGASTMSPIFHSLDAFQGTLVLDEADFRMSDKKADIVKILNNGSTRGMPVLRTEVSRSGEFNPRAFHVFGPKIVATRGHFQDVALESRFLVEEMSNDRMGHDVPVSLPDVWRSEALTLRNKLLRYRIANRATVRIRSMREDRSIHPRLSQILAPLRSISDDPELQESLSSLVAEAEATLRAERLESIEARVVEAIGELAVKSTGAIGIKEVTRVLESRYGSDFERPVSAKWIGTIVRRKLHLSTVKSHGVFVIPVAERGKLPRLYAHYGVTNDENDVADGPRGRVDQ